MLDSVISAVIVPKKAKYVERKQKRGAEWGGSAGKREDFYTEVCSAAW